MTSSLVRETRVTITCGKFLKYHRDSLVTWPHPDYTEIWNSPLVSLRLQSNSAVSLKRFDQEI
jgi:hypothetical protein